MEVEVLDITKDKGNFLLTNPCPYRVSVYLYKEKNPHSVKVGSATCNECPMNGKTDVDAKTISCTANAMGFKRRG